MQADFAVGLCLGIFTLFGLQLIFALISINHRQIIQARYPTCSVTRRRTGFALYAVIADAPGPGIEGNRIPIA